MKTKHIWEVGDLCIAVADRFSVSITNDVGGTTTLPRGRYLVRIVKEWGDYETGQVIHGELLDEKDVAKARKAGVTSLSPEQYRKYRASPDLTKQYAKAKKAFNPKIVYFSEHNCEPMKGR